MTQMSRCPACGAINRTIARFCHNCGKALGTVCARCGAHNPPAARFCNQCGFALGSPSPLEAGATAAPPAVAAVVSSLRLLDACTCQGIDRKAERPKGPPVHRFQSDDSAVWIYLRLANEAPAQQHKHRLFVQFYRPNGQIHRVRPRRELIVVNPGQREVHVTMFGLYIAGTDVVNHLGKWKAVIFLDEQMLTELGFEVSE